MQFKKIESCGHNLVFEVCGIRRIFRDDFEKGIGVVEQLFPPLAHHVLKFLSRHFPGKCAICVGYVCFLYYKYLYFVIFLNFLLLHDFLWNDDAERIPPFTNDCFCHSYTMYNSSLINFSQEKTETFRDSRVRDNFNYIVVLELMVSSDSELSFHIDCSDELLTQISMNLVGKVKRARSVFDKKAVR